MVPVGEQFTSFFFTLVIGLVLGVLIDAYRGFRRLSHPRPLTTILGDFFLWLFLALLAFFLLLLNNWGEVRVYVLVGIGIGLIAYRYWFSTMVLSLWYKFFLFLGRVFKLICLTIIFPFKLLKKLLFLPLGLISMLLDWLWRLTRGITKGIRFRIKRRLGGFKQWLLKVGRKNK